MFVQPKHDLAASRIREPAAVLRRIRVNGSHSRERLLRPGLVTREAVHREELLAQLDVRLHLRGGIDVRAVELRQCGKLKLNFERRVRGRAFRVNVGG